MEYKQTIGTTRYLLSQRTYKHVSDEKWNEIWWGHGLWARGECGEPNPARSRYIGRGKLKNWLHSVSRFICLSDVTSAGSLAHHVEFLHRIGSKIWVELNYIGRLFTSLGRVWNVNDSLAHNNRINVYYDYVE